MLLATYLKAREKNTCDSDHPTDHTQIPPTINPLFYHFCHFANFALFYLLHSGPISSVSVLRVTTVDVFCTLTTSACLIG